MLKLNLGCGEDYREGYVNIDVRENIHTDLIMDISQGFSMESYTWTASGLTAEKAKKLDNMVESDNTSVVDKILANDFLEHIEQNKVIHLIDEIWRVLHPDGLFQFRIPSTDGRGAFQDPTHRSFWNINSWLYWTNDEMRKQIGAKAKFRIEMLNDQPTGIGVIHTFGLLRAVK